MLTMRWKNGRIKYSFQPQNTTLSQSSTKKEMLQLAPLPLVHFTDATNQKIKSQQWYDKHYHHVDDIIDILLETFNNFLETHPVYQVQFDELHFRQVMIQTLYNTSFSAYKTFP